MTMMMMMMIIIIITKGPEKQNNNYISEESQNIKTCDSITLSKIGYSRSQANVTRTSRSLTWFL